MRDKPLGLKNKQNIERYGIGAFNQKAKESVWRYKEEWEKLTKRMGFWVDLTDPYITYETPYIESLWWIIKEFWKKGLLEQDFKILPWCVRCQTGLSSHEVGQGYKKTSDTAVYVKFKLKAGQKIGDFTTNDKTYILAWTTTPWTLPGNVGLAVGNKIEYQIAQKNDEFLITAQDAQVRIPWDGPVNFLEKKLKGENLIGVKYQSLFLIPEFKKSETAYKIYPADFVSAEDGTGVVHTAVMYGEDDYVLGKKVGLPTVHTVDETGHFIKSLGDRLGGLPIVSGQEKNKETETKILSVLGDKIFHQEKYEHDYPFCWRCNTPLLYYARQGWWVRTTKVKKELLANNKTINWVPEHLQNGRFGEFLKDVRDWAFSRERYWGTPLPIWKCNNCKHIEVIGSRADLIKHIPDASRNSYIGIRHGQATTNLKGIISSDEKKYPLTLTGTKQAEHGAALLKKQHIDLIISSPILRARQTAEIIGKQLGVPVRFDKRLKEINFGTFEEKTIKAYHAFFQNVNRKSVVPIPGGESLADVYSRHMLLLKELEETHSGKTILLAGHDYGLWLMSHGAVGTTAQEAVREDAASKDCFKHAVPFPMKYYHHLPRDEKGEINLHRPYVDSTLLVCSQCGSESMARVPEVADVWFDSGAMPFAQSHYPFDKKEKLAFPADYISEAVDQTRGWFYTLLAISTLLGKKAPFKNVISLGHVLDKNGQKMSKSKGNVVNPDEMIGKYGIDALRWYMYTINPPGEPKKFDERDLANKYRGFIQTFWNSFVLFDTYVKKTSARVPKPADLSVLDQWIIARIEELTRQVTDALESYDVTAAGRAIEEFVISDFSQWFLRRSRRRLQHPETKKEFEAVSRVSAYILLQLAILCAPFTPFLSEAIFQELKKKCALKEESVDLCAWTKATKKLSASGKKLIADMQAVRMICSEGLKLRAQAGIKVRQPLQDLRISNKELRNNKELLALIQDEINVKEISFGKEMLLDIVLTQELREEGMVRELVRNIQEMRRDMGLKPKDVIRCQFTGDAAIEAAVDRLQKQLKKDINAKTVTIGGKKVFKAEREVEMDSKKVWIGII